MLYKRLTSNTQILSLFLLGYISGISAPAIADTDTSAAQAVIHGLDYISVDYPGIFTDGKITNQDEYAEQQEIAQHTVHQAQTLPPHDRRDEVMAAITKVQQTIASRAPAKTVSSGARQAIALVLELYHPPVAPAVTPVIADAKPLFQSHCSGCHGLEGRGDGPQALGLSPAPANFHDYQRQQHRNLYSLYNTISLGVNGTAMPAFSNLTATQRWALAFYVGSLGAQEINTTAPEALLARPEYATAFPNLTSLVQFTPEEATLRWGHEGSAMLYYLRGHPQTLPDSSASPAEIARTMLDASVERLRAGDRVGAREDALAAYLDGYELMENQLNAAHPDMRANIERQLAQYREHIKDGAPLAQLEEEHRVVRYLITEAEKVLQENPASAAMNLVTALLILLREGIEAILVIAALVSVLLKTGRRQDLRYIHIGWSSALLLGLLTWYLASSALAITGAGRELTEGVTALVAAGMLLYVGFWLHNQSNSQQWQQYVRSKISTSLSTGALWGLSLIAFFAVYREVFETVLFYQSLWVGAQGDERNGILGGMMLGMVILGILAWLILRYSVRLPLKTFFKVNMVLMFLLAVVLAGKGIAAIQEAGRFPIDPVNIPQIPLLGIYPSWEGIGTQLGLIGLAGLWFGYQRLRRQPERDPANA